MLTMVHQQEVEQFAESFSSSNRRNINLINNSGQSCQKLIEDKLLHVIFND